jgi:hypothetical protein
MGRPNERDVHQTIVDGIEGTVGGERWPGLGVR